MKDQRNLQMIKNKEKVHGMGANAIENNDESVVLFFATRCPIGIAIGGVHFTAHFSNSMENNIFFLLPFPSYATVSQYNLNS